MISDGWSSRRLVLVGASAALLACHGRAVAYLPFGPCPIERDPSARPTILLTTRGDTWAGRASRDAASSYTFTDESAFDLSEACACSEPNCPREGTEVLRCRRSALEMARAEMDGWLRAFDEAPLLDGDGDSNSFRLLVLSNSGYRALVRLTERRGEVSVVAKALWKADMSRGTRESEDAPAFDNQAVWLLQVQRPARPDEWDRLLDYVDEARFWSMPTVRRGGTAVLDGETRILEGVRDGRQHVVRSTAGVREMKFERLTQYMLDLGPDFCP